MRELTEWMDSLDLPARPWLVLGKGPTFACHREVDLSAYNLLSLNHAVRELRVDVAHVIDADVVEACADRIEQNCRWLIMPRHPHVNFRAGPPLETHVERSEVLRRLDKAGRLIWYNLSSGPAHDGSPVIPVRYFSAEAALNLLGAMGVKKVRSLGIDGGQGYSPEFKDLGQTMLANGQPSFDLSAAEIEKTVAAHGIDYAPLVEPMRVFVGTDDSQLVAARVLEYSIRRHATRPVVVNYMLHVATPRPRRRRNRPRTGFSFRRFAIPRLCGYRGRALYVDADMQVFADLAELWQIPFGPHKVLCTYQEKRPDAWRNESGFKPGRQLSVMMLDCSRLAWDAEEIIRGLDEGRYDYKQLMSDLCIVDPGEISDGLPPEWNCLEWHEPGRSKLVHYTVVPTQPWKNDDNPLRGVWEECYREAVAAGSVPCGEVRTGVMAGHLKSSLLSALAASPEGASSAGDIGGLDHWKYRVVEPTRTFVRRLRRLVGGGLRTLASATRDGPAGANRKRST